MDHPAITRTVLWNRLDQPGLEYAMLQAAERGWLMQGDAITPIGGMPARVVYQIRVSEGWLPHRVAVDVLVGAQRQRLHLINHARRGWRTRPDNQPVPHLQGCVDVDLGLSPVTNTLAINRLNLEIGQTADLTTAWVRFPTSLGDDLTIVPLAQRYTRLDATHYQYRRGESHDSLTFEALIRVDEMGLVEYYEGGWERAAVADV